MILSRIILKVYYRIGHLAGVIICMGGVAALIAADTQHDHSPGKVFQEINCRYAMLN